MWAYHDSRDSRYRIPFGAAPTGGTVTLGLSIGGDSGAHVALRTWVDGEGEAFVPMTGEPEGDHLRFFVRVHARGPCDRVVLLRDRAL